MNNKLIFVLGAIAVAASLGVGAHIVKSGNLQAGVLKSTVADKALVDAKTAKTIPGGTTGEKVFLMGGGDPNLAGNWMFNNVLSSTDSYTYNQIQPSAAWSARQGQSSFYFNNKIWVVGGEILVGNTLTPTYDLWSSPDGINWSLVSNSTPWKTGVSISVFQGKIWMMGGNVNGVFVNDIWSSSDGVTWIQNVTPPQWGPRSYTVTTVFQNKLWIMGGYSLTNPNPGYLLVDIWSSTDGITWTQSTPAFIPPRPFLSQPKVVVLNGSMFLFANDGSNPPQFTSIWSSLDGITWSQINPNILYSGRSGYQPFTLNGEMVVVGGQSAISGPPTLDDAWSSINGITWVQNSTHFSPTNGVAGYSVVVTPKSFGCKIQAEIIPKTNQLNAGAHQTTYEFKLTSCANPITLKQIDFTTSQSAKVLRKNFKLETNSTLVANAMPPVYGSALVYPKFQTNYVIPAYTTQRFVMTEDVSGNVVPGANITSTLKSISADLGSTTATWTNTFPLGATTLTH